MKPIQLFLAVGACLSLAVPALAIPEPENLDRMEREIEDHAQQVEARVHHLNEAAEHLAEAGLKDQANELRGKAKALHQELHNKIRHIEELREQQARRAREASNREREEAEARREAELAAEHAKQVAENWDRIRDAAHGKHPQTDKPRTNNPTKPRTSDRAVPQTQQRPVRPGPDQPAYDRQSRILYEILRTLQDMNSKLDAMHEGHSDDHHGDHHDDDHGDHHEEDEDHDGHHHRESEEEHKAHGHDKRRG